MFELKIKQKNKGNNYTEDHFYYSEDLKKLFDLIQLSIELSDEEISYVIREIEEGQDEDDEE